MYHMFIAVFLKINMHVLIYVYSLKSTQLKKQRKHGIYKAYIYSLIKKKYIELKKSGHL